MSRYLVVVSWVLVAVALVISPASPAAPDAARTTLTIRTSDFGRIVFDSSGRALYAFSRDRGTSACYGACAAAWPPYLVRGALRAPAGVSPGLLGTTRRRDGSRQLTFAGRPLYYYVGDRAPGVVLCQNISEYGGLWQVARPSGKLVR
jgi:predicted lipoprotein with Yx(FWY)xxD motif